MTPLEAAIAVVDAEPEYSLRQATVRAMLVGYDHKYADSMHDYQIHRVEEAITAPLFNPETQAKSRTYITGGVIDVDLSDGRGHGFMDHKSSSDDIEDPNSPYWRQLVVESQLDHYILNKHINGEKTDWAVWDVMRKPGIRPRRIEKAEQKTLETDGTYWGARFDPDTIRAAIADGRESLQLYEARLIAECVEKPERYFQRRRITRTSDQILRYAEELWDDGQDLLVAKRTSRHSRNAKSCMMYGRPCVFLGICANEDSADSGKWRTKSFVHNEFPVFDDGKGGRTLLTNSRISMFKTCKQKEYLAYELGLESNDSDEAESLAFGTLWHKALAAYFTTIKEMQQNGNATTARTAEERASTTTVNA